MDQWAETQAWSIEDLVEAAGRLPVPATLLNTDEPSLLLPGEMMGRINAQLRSLGHSAHPEHPAYAPHFANLIFHSLAARYREVLVQVAALTGKELKRLFVVGGGSRNAYLNGLIAEATGLEVHRGSAESSTLGNFAIQLAVLEAHPAPTPDLIYRYAAQFESVRILS